jgi:uncharacterized damage-inducible protein DinB
MGELERIADQLKRSFQGEAWPGPSVLEALEKVPAERAAARPLPQGHSIWELVLHVIATYQLVLRRLRGDAAPLSPDEDWPSVEDTGEKAWQSALTGLKRSHSELLQALSLVSDAQLDEPILPGLSSRYVTLHGLVQHNLYHAGQIALLKKA